MNKKIDIKQIFSIITTILLLAAHAIVIVMFFNVSRYYNMYPELFNNVVIIVVCLFIILDIIFFVGFKTKDLIQKIIICVLTICITAGGCYGTYIMSKTNELVDNVVDTGENDRYETVGGVFVTYGDDRYSTVSSLEDLAKLSDFTIGALAESSKDSLSAIGEEKLSEANVKGYEMKYYANNTDLLFALIGDEVDVVIFSNMYQAIFKADENVDYTSYLNNIHEIEQFSKDIVVESNTSNRDLSKDPFNVLLIGWSPIIGSTTIGLADAIIVASVNPQTYTISMMSIARDSYVPISCYGGQCDKINSGRGTSMDCFVSTVEDLIGEEIDFYMEIDFSGFADLCGHFGGIEIDNPVSFELDGVYVPAGHYIADGWQALEFARERHHMPNGDFDRQQHQKEVIMQLAKQFLKHSLTDALEIFNYVSDRLNTNMTLNQLTSMFNMLKNTKRYTGLSVFNMLDMHALRITGYADWHYNDTYELPLWIYRLYQGSIDESLDHMQEVLGNYKSINQDSGFSFDANNKYVREPFYSTSYDEVEEHEVLPIYYINLTSMSYKDALEWARNNGASLVPTFIEKGEDGYDESLDGMVISQSVAYGKRVSKYPTCNITVMGDGKIKLPDFSSWGKDGLERAKQWCDDNKLSYEKIVTYITKDNPDGYVSGEVYKMKYEGDVVNIYYYSECGEHSVPNERGDACLCKEADGYFANGAVCSLKKDVPNVTGKTLDEANSLVGNEFVIKATEIYSNSIESGKIISQDVTGKAFIGSEIKVVVSKGTLSCEEGYEADYNEQTCKLTILDCGANKHQDGTTCVLDTGYKDVGVCDDENGYKDDGTGVCSLECASGYEDSGSGCTLIES